MIYIIIGSIGGFVIALAVYVGRSIRKNKTVKESDLLFESKMTANSLFSADFGFKSEFYYPQFEKEISIKIENDMDLVNNIHVTLNDMLLQETSQETIDFITQEIKVIESLSSDIKSGTTRTDVSEIIEQTVKKLSRSLTLDDKTTNRLATVNPMLNHMATLRPVRRASMVDQKTTIDLIREGIN
jgi:hypothetical protein